MSFVLYPPFFPPKHHSASESPYSDLDCWHSGLLPASNLALRTFINPPQGLNKFKILQRSVLLSYIHSNSWLWHACTPVHNMASSLPLELHLLFSTSITSPEDFYVQVFVYRHSFFLNYSSHRLFTWKPNLFLNTILKPPPKTLGNPSACTWMWHSEVAESCPTLCNSMGGSLSGSSVHGIFQVRVLEWVAISFSRGNSQPRDQSRVSRIGGRCFNLWATREAWLKCKES